MTKNSASRLSCTAVFFAMAFSFTGEAMAGCQVNFPKVRLTDTGVGSVAPDVKWNGKEYSVLCKTGPDMDTTELVRLRVDRTGQKTGTRTFYTNTVWSSVPFQAVGNGTAGLAWRSVSTTIDQILFSVIDDGDNLLFPEIPINVADIRIFDDPSIAWDGDNYVVVWSEAEELAVLPKIWLRKISPSGVLVGNVVQVSDGTSTAKWPAVVWTGTQCLVFWTDDRDPSTRRPEVFSAALSVDGNKLCGDTRVTDGAFAVGGWFGTAWNGTECGVVFPNSNLVTSRLTIAFVSTDEQGKPLQPFKKVIEELLVDDYSWPDLVWDGEHYAMSCAMEARAVDFAILDRTGEIIYSYFPLFDCPDGCERPRIAWSGTEFAYVWTDWGWEAGKKEVSFTTLTCTYPRYQVLRSDQDTELPDNPDTRFETDTLPFLDPDGVLEPGPLGPLLFYQAVPGIPRIWLGKTGDSVSIDEYR